MRHVLRAVLSAILLSAISGTAAAAADYPPPKQGDFIVHDFKFHDGAVMAELKLHYTTVGEPTGRPVLVLHGSGGSAASMLTPAFAGELFGAGQPLDASKYYIIIPDGIGHGKSSKPSDGMKTAFPKYDYDDMVEAQYRLVREGLGVRHLRLVIGNSMGGMHTWLWAEKYPDMMDVAVPMASQPSAMAARNWILRRMMIETIRHDPDYNNGNYTSQPRMMKYAVATYGFASPAARLPTRTRRRQRKRPTTWSTSGWRRRSQPTPTTSSINGRPRTITMQPLIFHVSKPRCWRSMQPTTSAIRRRRASLPMRSDRSSMAASI